MQKKLKTLILSAIILIAAAVYLQPLKVFAGSCALGVTLEKPEVTVGDTFSVVLSVDADVELSEVSLYVVYDDEKILFRNEASDSCCIGDRDKKFVKVYENGIQKMSQKYLMNFIAIAPGSSNFTIILDKITDASDVQLSASTTSANIKINATSSASEDATLKSLRVSPGELSPAFSPDVYIYTVNVSKDTNSIYVGAVANDENAKVRINGHETLYPGPNEVHVCVTAENGTILDYIVNVIKDEDTQKPTLTPTQGPTSTPAPTPTEAALSQKLNVTAKDGKLYFTGDFNYEILDTSESVEIPNGYLRTKMMIDGESIIVYAPATDESTDFVLIVLRTKAGTPALYRYDRIEKTLQRYNPKDIKIRGEANDPALSSEVADTLAEYEKMTGKFGMILSGVVILWLVTLLILLYVLRKSKDTDDKL